MIRGLYRLALPIALAMGLSACSNARESLGLTKTSPDEFRVVSRAPLTVPPDFTLRPPDPGAPRPQVGTPTDQARTAVTGVGYQDFQEHGRKDTGGAYSLGEQALLTAVGADEADPNIRQVVDQETSRINSESEDFLRALVFWREDEPTGVLLDPEGEANRLRENATLGRDVTEGETPTIERKEKAIFEDLF